MLKCGHIKQFLEGYEVTSYMLRFIECYTHALKGTSWEMP